MSLVLIGLVVAVVSIPIIRIAYLAYWEEKARVAETSDEDPRPKQSEDLRDDR